MSLSHRPLHSAIALSGAAMRGEAAGAMKPARTAMRMRTMRNDPARARGGEPNATRGQRNEARGNRRARMTGAPLECRRAEGLGGGPLTMAKGGVVLKKEKTFQL